MPSDTPDKISETAHPGGRESFNLVANQARDVLRAKGYTEREIEEELTRAFRDDVKTEGSRISRN